MNRVGKLEAVEKLPHSKYLCKCDCGNERIVKIGHFNSGKIKSCGCHKPQHGHATGGKHSREYVSWGNMIARCHRPTNKRFKDYGAKGIAVCALWRASFQAFIDDMGPCPLGFTIEREDNTQGYYADNCRWASRVDQQRNRAMSVLWIVDGVEYPTAFEAGEAYEVSAHTIGAWCKGRVADGRYYPPRDNCRVVPIYDGGA